MNNQSNAKSRLNRTCPGSSSLKLLLLMLLSVLSLAAKAQFNFTTNNGTITITGYTGTNRLVVIPDMTNGYPVTAIGQSAFQSTSATNVILPDTITSIGSLAFADTASLSSVNIPDNVTNIGGYAFDRCLQLPGIMIPAGVISVGPDAFFGCTNLGSVVISNNILSASEFQQCFTLTNVTLAGAVPAIPTDAFNYCPMASITIPDTVTNIGMYAFENCTGLATIAISPGVTTISPFAFAGCVSLTNILVSSSITNIGAQAFANCTHLVRAFFQGNAPGFGDAVFYGDNVTVYSISGKSGWPLAGVNNVIVNETFPALTITQPFNNEYVIDAAEFNITGTAGGNAPLAGVWFQVNSNGWNPATTKNGWINWSATADLLLVGTNLVQAYALDGFGNSNNVSVNFIDISSFTFITNDGTIMITGYTGSGGAITIPGILNYLPVVSIGSQAFLNDYNITSVTIPDGVTNIGDSAFQSCAGLTNVVIPGSITSIGNDAFSGTSLAGIMIDSNLTSIGDDAFSNCTSLATVYFAGNAPINVGSDIFLNDNEAVVYYLPDTTGWTSMFGGISAVEVDETVVITAPYPDESMTNGIFTVTGTVGGSVPVSSVWFQINANGWVEAVTTNSWTNWTVASSVTASNVVNGTNVLRAYCVDDFGDISPITTNDIVFLCNFYFRNQNGTVTITGYNSTNGLAIIPDTINGFPVTSIANNAFDVCQVLTNVVISTNVTSIGSYAFLSCLNLVSITIPDSVTSIGTQTFGTCRSLASIYIPASVTGIGVMSFQECYSLQGINVDPANPNYSSLNGVLFDKNLDTLVAFPGGQGPSYVVPGSVTNIAYGAFSECINLNSITFPPALTGLSDWSFSFCYGLTSMYFEGSPPALGGSYVFYPDTKITCYYAPGTTGWGTSFAGFPSTLWLPQMQTSNPAAAAQSNSFSFNINWVSRQTVVVEAATNLFNPAWSPIWTNTLVGSSTNFSDPQWTNYPARFYRISAP